jgi:small subunit ribosomal protein S21
MTYVKVGENESFENALKRFKRKCAQEGIFRELKRRQFFLNDRNVRYQKARQKKQRWK